jgi:hypothetical protein
MEARLITKDMMAKKISILNSIIASSVMTAHNRDYDTPIL